MEIKEIDERKNIKINSMKVSYEKAIEALISYKMKKKHLKEQCDIDDEDEVQEITAAWTPMNKDGPVCGHVIKHLQRKIDWKNTSRKSPLSSGESIVAKCS